MRSTPGSRPPPSSLADVIISKTAYPSLVSDRIKHRESDANCDCLRTPKFIDLADIQSEPFRVHISNIMTGPPQGGPAAPNVGLHDGDVVWGKVKGFPAWPGQIMPQHLGSKSILGANKHGAEFLIAFLGDSSYGWFDAGDLVPFSEWYNEKKKQKCKPSRAKEYKKAVEEGKEHWDKREGHMTANRIQPPILPLYNHPSLPDDPQGFKRAEFKKAVEEGKEFKKAVEEGKELWDKREGRTPETNHDPVDFMDTKTWTPSMILTVDMNALVIPAAPTAAVLKACSGGKAVNWLRAAARSIDEGVQVTNMKSEFAMSQLWSMMRARCRKVDRKKLYPPSDAEDEPERDEPPKAQGPPKTHAKASIKSRAALDMLADIAGGGMSDALKLTKKKMKKLKRQRETEREGGEDAQSAGEAAREEMKERKKKKVKRVMSIQEEEEGAPPGESEAGGVKKGKKKKKVKRVMAIQEEDMDEEEGAPAGGSEAGEVRRKIGRPLKVKSKEGGQDKAEEADEGEMEMEKAFGKGEDPEDRRHALYGGDLSVELREVAKLLQSAARAPFSMDLASWREEGCMAGAGYLRFREASFELSALNSPDEGVPQEIGMVLRGALETLGAIPTAVEADQLLQRAKVPASASPGARAPRRPNTGLAMKKLVKSRLLKGNKVEKACDDDDDSSSEGSDTESDGGRQVEDFVFIFKGFPPYKDPRRPSTGLAVKKLVKSRPLKGNKIEKASDDDDDSSSEGSDTESDGGRLPALKVKTAAVKRSKGPASPDRKPIMVDVPFVKYADKPCLATKQAFMVEYQKYLGETDKPQPPIPKVAGYDYDFYTIFMLVAKKGGGKCVTAQGKWRMIALKWKEDLRVCSNVGKKIESAYKKTLLLGFEDSISKGAPSHMVKAEKRDKNGTLVFEEKKEDSDDEQKNMSRPRQSSMSYKPVADKRAQPSSQPSKAGRARTRILIFYPSGTSMPTAAAVVHALKRFGVSDKESVEINNTRSILMVDFSDEEQASTAYPSIKKLAWSLFTEMRLNRDAKITIP
eukprot:gene488-1894_t